MKPNPIAENVLGTMGTICWTGQLIPQVWKNYKDKKTFGLSPLLMLLWGISSAFLGVYAILQDLNIPLKIQPQLFGFLALLSWGQCLYYDPCRRNKKRFSVFITVGTMILVGALEVMLVFVSRPAYKRGIVAPVKLYGVLSALLIAVGLLPQYWEIYVLGEVKGVSYTFICIDMLGGLLNDLSLAFASEFDALAAVTYTLVTVMDSVIIFAAIILNPRARKRRRLAAAATDAALANVESRSPHNTIPETASIEKREVSLGGGDADVTHSTTLRPATVTGNGDIEKTAAVDEKIDVNGAGCIGNLSGGPGSGTTTIVDDSESLNTARRTADVTSVFTGAFDAEGRVVGGGIEGDEGDAENMC